MAVRSFPVYLWVYMHAYRRETATFFNIKCPNELFFYVWKKYLTKNQKPRVKRSQKPNGHAYWLQTAANSTQIRDFGSKMQQIQARSQKPKEPEAKSQKPEAKSQKQKKTQKQCKKIALQSTFSIPCAFYLLTHGSAKTYLHLGVIMVSCCWYHAPFLAIFPLLWLFVSWVAFS